MPNEDRVRSTRKQVIFLLGGKCAVCGFSDERALQVDHVNNDGFIHRRRLESGGKTNLQNVTYQYLKMALTQIVTGIKTIQLLCANCNAIKHYEHRMFLKEAMNAQEIDRLCEESEAIETGERR
jgi:hypothetical protein